MRVVPGRGLEVVLPRGVPMREALAFVRREERWVLAALAKLQQQADAAVPLRDGSALPYLGMSLTLVVSHGARSTIRRVGGELHVCVADGMAPDCALEAWYRADARRVMGERVDAHAATLDVAYGRITIKDTRSRWGSCSSKGNLNFSWRLLLAPYAVMDYVVAHEVAHLRELNHSPRFWTAVATLCPDYRTHRTWLGAHGAELAVWPGAG